MRTRRGDASGTPFKPGRKKTGGRTKGTRNKLPQEIRAFFKSVVHSPKFQDKLRERAEKGTLSGTELTLMLAYAIGKPKDVLEIERPPESPMREAMKLMKPEEIRIIAAAAARVIEARKNEAAAKALPENTPAR